MEPNEAPSAETASLTAPAEAGKDRRAMELPSAGRGLKGRVLLPANAPADPTVSVARLSEDALARVLSCLRTLLGSNEHARLSAHFAALRSADELLVTIVRRYEIAPAP